MRRTNEGWRYGFGTAGVRIIALACLAAGCREAHKTARIPVIAKVGEREITEADFLTEVERRRHRDAFLSVDKAVVMKDLVAHAALVQRAQAAGMEADPRVRREMDNLLIGNLMDKELRPRLDSIQVMPEEVKTFYTNHLANYTRPAQVRLSILKLEVEPKASTAQKADVRKRMAEARAKVLADPPRGRGVVNSGFGRLAVDYSDDQASRYRGGDIGWIEQGHDPARWPREVIEAGVGLPVGQYSNLIEAPGGFYLVTKTDSREATVTPLSEVEAVIRQHLIAEKQRDLEAAYRNEALRLTSMTIDSNALAALTIPSAGIAVPPPREVPALPGNPGKEVRP